MKSRSSLNHVFRSVWNHALGAMVAVAEIAGRGQGASSGLGSAAAATPSRFAALPLCMAVAWGAAVPATWANPAGGVVIQGQATFDASQTNKLLITTQNAPGTSQSAINWQSFSIPVGNTTYFQQPSATSTSINRVVTNMPSQLFGKLGSNGNLVLVNQAGIAVGAGAVVDTAGFTASALQMTEADALVGRLRFGDASAAGAALAGDVSVLGNIMARSADVVLLGANVAAGANALVRAPNGAISLVAGSAFSISARGLEGINFEVQAPSHSAVNLGTLQGDAVGIFAGTLKHSGLIQATTAAMEGGKVVLKAAGDTYLEGTGKISATGTKGGSVDVLGNRVALTDQAAIDVSGFQGGGTVRIGGDYQGKNSEVANANVTYFGPQASVNADATDQGNGGKVIVWADDTTRAYGSMSAKGGANGGNGGFVETSGHNYLSVAGARVDTRAALGLTGSWLLDPTNITITHAATGTGAVFANNVFQNGGGPTSTLTDFDINTALLSTDVTVSTTPSPSGYGGSVGDIAVGSGVAIVNTSTGTRSLTLQADNNITGSTASISGSVGNPLNVTLSAAGAIDLTNTTINTSGGNITLTASSGNVSLGLMSAGAGVVNVTAGSNILDGNGSGTANIIANTAYLTANVGALRSIDADTQVSTLTVDNDLVNATGINPTNSINIRNTGSALSWVNVYSDADTNQVTVTNNNDIGLGTISGAVNITIKATGGGSSINFSEGSLSSVGNILLQADSNISTDFGSITSTSGNIDLVAGTSVDDSSDGITVPSSGRLLIWAPGPNSVTLGTLVPDFIQYGSTWNTSNPTATLSTGNGFMYSATPTITSGLVGAVSKTYDGLTSIGMSGASLSVAGYNSPYSDVMTNAVLAGGVTGVLSDPNQGSSKTVTVSGASITGIYSVFGVTNFINVPIYGYAATGNIGTVSPAAVTASAISLNGTREYDGTNIVRAGIFELIGLVGNETLRLSGAGTVADKNVGANKPVSLGSLALGDGSGLASNYTFDGGTAYATITQATISTVGGIKAANKTYDGTTNATIDTSAATFAGKIASDTLTLASATGAFADKNAGSGKTVNIAVSLGGADAGNYTLQSDTVTTTANIDKAALSAVSGLTAANKIYDGKTDAQIATANASFTGKIAGDDLGVTGAVGAFVDKTAANGKKVNITGITLSGADAGNYVLPNIALTAIATIDKATITAVNGITAASKTYDGKTEAQIDTASAKLAGKVTGDSLEVTGAVGTFADKNAATGKAVNIKGLALGGADAGNYTLSSSLAGATAVADIKHKELVVGGIAAANKVYDGKLDATLNTAATTLAGQIEGDFVSISAADIKGAFVDKNVGAGKVVNLTGLKLAGADAGNYTPVAQSATKADITVRPSSVWSGAVSNNWSDAGNWDALPDGANVLAVNIGPGSGTVAFDGGSVTLQSLSSAQTLTIGGGSLQVSGSLSTSGFSQTAGTVSGAGSFTASGTFSQSGGSIDMVSITAMQNSGSLTVNNLKAGSVNLTGGSISQTAGGGIETTTLTTQSVGGTVLNGTGNKLENWNAFNTGSGALRLINTGLINVTAINDGGDFNIESFGGVVTKGQVQSSGAISITAHSPLVVGADGLSAVGNIVLTATNLTSAGNITLDGPIVSSTGSVAMKAANNLTQNSSVSAPLGVSADAGGTLVMGPLAISGAFPVSYVVASQPVTPPPSLGSFSKAGDAVVALIATSPAVETPAEKQVLAAAAVPVKKKDDDKDTSKETLVSEAAGICRP